MVAVAGGVLAGRLRARAGIHAPRHHLRGWYLVVVGIALHVGSTTTSEDVATLFEGGSLAVLACFAGLNWTVTGLAVAGLGLVLNLVALVINNGTPVRGAALVDVGAATPEELATYEVDPPRHLETSADRLAALGDTIAVPGLDLVVSFGDLIALVGLADGLRDLTRRRAKGPDHDHRASDDGEADEDDDQGSDAATTDDSAVQDWGTAPNPAPESGSQYSAKSDRRAAEASEFWRDARVDPSPAHLAARHDK